MTIRRKGKEKENRISHKTIKYLNQIHKSARYLHRTGFFFKPNEIVEVCYQGFTEKIYRKTFPEDSIVKI